MERLTTLPSPRLQRWLPLLLVLGYVGLIEWLWGWGTILAAWRAMPPATLALGAGLMGVSYAVRAWRLVDYFPAVARGRFPLMLRLTLQHNLFNHLLPARSGELSFPLLMKRWFDVPWATATAALLWLRLLDLHTLLAIGLLALGRAWLPAGWWGPVLALWLALPVAAWLGHGPLRRRVERLRSPRLRETGLRALAGLREDGTAFLRSWAFTWGNWAVKLGVLIAVLGQLLPLPLPRLALAVTSGELTSVLPLHAPGGIGTYEAGVVAGLAGAAPLSAAAAAAINLHLFLLTLAALTGLLALLPWPAPRPAP